MILVVHASKHGATEGIARFIAERLTERGRQADALPAAAPGELGDPEAVVLGSAIYAGSWLKETTEFARRHRGALTQIPLWLFSTGPLGTEVKDEEQQPKQLPELEEILQPRDHHLFFGALDRSTLGFAERMMVPIQIRRRPTLPPIRKTSRFLGTGPSCSVGHGN